MKTLQTFHNICVSNINNITSEFNYYAAKVDIFHIILLFHVVLSLVMKNALRK